MQGKWQDYVALMRLNKPIGIGLLLWPTLWALWIAAQGMPSWHLLLVFVLGVVLMRSAGCVINDFADRHWDGAVERTAQRPLATGRVSVKEALLLFVGLCLVAFALVLTTNTLTILLSLAAVVLAFIYPFMKRFTHLPQLVLGLAFAWAIPMSFAAVQNQIPPVAWWLLAANVAWTVAYDTLYAMVDRNDDVKVGIKSTAILFGEHAATAVALLQLLTLLLLIVVGIDQRFGLYYQAGVLAMGALFIRQQLMIRSQLRADCFRAFLNNNWAGMVVFIGLIFEYAMR